MAAQIVSYLIPLLDEANHLMGVEPAPHDAPPPGHDLVGCVLHTI